MHLTLVAQTGQPLSSHYDEKKCHEAAKFTLHAHDAGEHKVWRIWGTGKIRVYFVYAPDKRIVVLKTWAKRKDKLTQGEIDQLTSLAKEVLLILEGAAFADYEI